MLLLLFVSLCVCCSLYGGEYNCVRISGLLRRDRDARTEKPALKQTLRIFARKLYGYCLLFFVV